MKGLIVLSLFDGMSCGQIALRELGVKIDTYYASEVDKHAILQTQLNFPDTVQLGDVRNVDGRKLGYIDLLIGGSPCQSFSFAGKRTGMSTKQHEEIYTLDRYLELKHEGFEFEGQSYLFWEYMRILHELRETNPNVFFLLENVEMGKKWKKVLSNAIGLRGVHINSALVSAQIRKRIYWTNIRTTSDIFGNPHPDIPQPKDRGILLRDILQDDAEVDESYYLKDETVKTLLEHKARNEKKGNGFGVVFHHGGGKMHAIKVGGKGVDDLVMIVASRGRRTVGNGTKTAQSLEPCPVEGKTNCLTTVAKDNLIVKADGSVEACRIRRLTPTECARLQTVPEWYKWKCSKTQQYKMLGNGWTVEVIKHILSFLPSEMTTK